MDAGKAEIKQVTEWPKRARTANWENGILTLDGKKKLEVPELTAEIMERLDGWRRAEL